MDAAERAIGQADQTWKFQPFAPSTALARIERHPEGCVRADI
jgi:hypothetical protein